MSCFELLALSILLLIERRRAAWEGTQEGDIHMLQRGIEMATEQNYSSLTVELGFSALEALHCGLEVSPPRARIELTEPLSVL